LGVHDYVDCTPAMAEGRDGSGSEGAAWRGMETWFEKGEAGTRKRR